MVYRNGTSDVNGYVIKMGALYMTPPNSRDSYTKYLHEARVFNTQEEADKFPIAEHEVIVFIPDMYEATAAESNT